MIKEGKNNNNEKIKQDFVINKDDSLDQLSEEDDYFDYSKKLNIKNIPIVNTITKPLSLETFENLNIEEGGVKKILLIGETGSGKSTFIELMINLLNTQEKIKISSTGYDSFTIVPKTYFFKNIKLVDTPGLNDSNDEDQNHLDNMYEFCMNEQPFDGIILCIEKSDRIKKSLKELLSYYKIFLNLNIKQKIAVCITKTNDKTYISNIRKTLSKIGYNCELFFSTWILKENDEVLVKILNNSLTNEIQFTTFQSVQTLKDKLEKLTNEKQKNEDTLDKLTKQYQNLKDNKNEEIQKIKNEMENKIELLNKQKKRTNFGLC